MDKIIEPRYQDYFEACYHGLKLPGIQIREVKQAFYAGYLDLCKLLLSEVANLSLEQGAEVIKQIMMRIKDEAYDELLANIAPKN